MSPISTNTPEPVRPATVAAPSKTHQYLSIALQFAFLIVFIAYASYTPKPAPAPVPLPPAPSASTPVLAARPSHTIDVERFRGGRPASFRFAASLVRNGRFASRAELDGWWEIEARKPRNAHAELLDGLCGVAGQLIDRDGIASAYESIAASLDKTEPPRGAKAAP